MRSELREAEVVHVVARMLMFRPATAVWSPARIGERRGNDRSFPIRSVLECVALILQSMTDLDPETTITSIDGVGAYDLISRNDA